MALLSKVQTDYIFIRLHYTNSNNHSIRVQYVSLTLVLTIKANRYANNKKHHSVADCIQTENSSKYYNGVCFSLDRKHPLTQYISTASRSRLHIHPMCICVLLEMRILYRKLENLGRNQGQKICGNITLVLRDCPLKSWTNSHHPILEVYDYLLQTVFCYKNFSMHISLQS